MSTKEAAVQLGTLARPVLDQIIHSPHTSERNLKHIGSAKAMLLHTPSKAQPRLTLN